MICSSRRILAVALACAGAFAAVPAFSSAPAGAAVACVPEGSLIVNPVAGAGCVAITATSGTTLAIVWIDLTPGWTYVVTNDGSKGRVEIRFTETATGDRRELRVEFGRTVIK